MRGFKYFIISILVLGCTYLLIQDAIADEHQVLPLSSRIMINNSTDGKVSFCLMQLSGVDSANAVALSRQLIIDEQTMSLQLLNYFPSVFEYMVQGKSKPLFEVAVVAQDQRAKSVACQLRIKAGSHQGFDIALGDSYHYQQISPQHSITLMSQYYICNLKQLNDDTLRLTVMRGLDWATI